MTPLELQNDLAKEIEEVLKTMLFKNAKGGQEKMKAYLQNLPKRMQTIQTIQTGNIMSDDDEEEDPYPYCLVKIESGQLSTNANVQDIKNILIFGIYDDDPNCQGHSSVLNIIQKISQRFIKNPVLANKYRLNEKAGINWAINDDDSYPYYFGGMELTWETAFVSREDNYA